MGVVLTRWYTDTPPTDDEGLPVAELEVGAADEVAASLQDGPLLLPGEGGRLAIVRWDPSLEIDGVRSVERYGPTGQDHPVLDDTTGFMSLSLIDPANGCRVGFCASSGWFEDPCHGSRYNRWGEWTFGPSPRGLDRFASRIRGDGVLVVALTRQLTGPARVEGVLDEVPAGPNCISS